MRDEERDWIIYHLAIREKTVTFDDIVRDSGFSPDTVRQSLSRLTNAFLLDISGDTIRVLSIGESVVRCQCRFMKDSPVIFEDGVIKAREHDAEDR